MKVEKWIDRNIPSLQGKRILITGANSGIGFEAAKIFASKGAELLLACRNAKRAEKAKEDILALYPKTKITILSYDQSSFESIDNCVASIIQQFDYIDVVVCNAGIYHPEKHLVTKDGFPLTMGTNYIGCYYFVEKLRPFLEKHPNGRIIFVSSLTYKTKKKINENILTMTEERVTESYKASKIAIAKYFSVLVSKTPLCVLMMHPGVASTNIYSSTNSHFPRWFMSLAHRVLPIFTHSPKKASLGIVLLASQENATSGTILGPRGLGEWSGFPKKRKLPKRHLQDAEQFVSFTKNLVEKKKEEMKNA